MKPLLSLVMIVKDEAASIKGVIESCKPWVDKVTILDTGSTDGTQDLVRECGFSVKEVPWEGYAKSRNRALEIDAQEPTEFQLVLSGDEYLQGGEKLREHLEKHRNTYVDCHFIWLTLNDAAMRSPRVFRTNSGWRYDDFDCGVHEVPVHVNKAAQKDFAQGVVIKHVVSDETKRLENIEHVHIPLLRGALDRNPNNERALIFLAQSHEALMNYYEPWEKLTYSMESMALLKRRLMIPTGLAIERNHCEMQWLDHARIAGIFTDEEIYSRAKALLEKDPKRPEPAFLMAAVKMTMAMAEKKGHGSVPDLYDHFKKVTVLVDEIGQVDSSVPISLAIGRQAHYFAGVLAKQIAAKEPAFLQIAKEHVQAGLSLGGSKEMFSVIGLDPAN